MWVRQLWALLLFIPLLGFNQDLNISEVLPNPSPLLNDHEEVSVLISTDFHTSTGKLILDSVQLEIKKPDNSILYIHEALTISYTQTTFDTLFLATRVDFSLLGRYELITKVFYRADGISRTAMELSTTGRMNSAKLSLPIIENFEETEGTSYLEEDEINIAGLASATYLKAGPSYDGLLTLEKCSEFSFFQCNGHITDRFARLTGSYENNLIFTYDLSDYSASTDQLRFEVKLQGFELAADADVQILLRGHADQPWIEIYDWSNDPKHNDQIRTVSKGDISKVLLENSQDYGTAFQLAFRTESFNIYYPPAVQALAIDDIVIAEASPSDIAVGEATIAPLGLITETPEPLNVQLINRGTSEISEIPITAHITFPDGNTLEHSEVVTESIPSGETLTYNFKGEVNFTEVGQYQLQFSTNLAEDTNETNDVSRRYFTGKLNPYKRDLPFIVDFEDVMGTQSYDVIDFEGVPGYSFYTDVINEGASFQFDEAFGSKIYNRVAGGPEFSNDLIFTLDLSENEVNNYQPELSFRFWYNKRGILEDEDDVIFIRGNMEMPWLPLLEYKDLAPQNIQDITVSNISETLISNSQEFGESFQIRFGVSGEIDLKLDDVFFGEKVLSSEGVSTSVTLFPNPTHDYLTLIGDYSSIEPKSIQLTDLLGRVISVRVDKKSDQQIALDLRSLKNGMYLLTWTENGNPQTRKIIRE